MKSSSRIFYSRIIFITGIVLLTSLSGLFIYETYQENSSSDAVSDTNVIRQSLEEIFSTLKGRESAIRGYVITGDSSYLRPEAFSALPEAQFNTIDSLIAGNPEQVRNLKKLKAHFDSCIRIQYAVMSSAGTPENFRSNRFQTTLKTAATQMDSIRTTIVKMQGIELSLAKHRALEVQKHTVIATMVGVGVGLFSMIVFVVAFYFIDQELKRSQNYIDETVSLNTKIAEINTELEKANRSLQNLNAELEDKNFQLEKYATELSAFTRITSHDMQEPLRKVEFFISIVEDREQRNLSDEGKKYLEKIKLSVSRMRQLFLSMLEFSLTNAVDNNVEGVDLNDVLQQAIHSLKVNIKETNAVIKNDPLPRVNGIRYQLIQLFENILNNAIRFRKNDVAPQIQITHTFVHTSNYALRGLKNDSEYHQIDFRDNGIGFDPKYAERIFEIFQRLIAKNDSYGIGIGLAICRKIAENHGGMLTARSQPNVGSVFSFYIPVNS